MVSILKDYLSNDSEGNKRIYAPSIIAVKAGEIVGFDDETGYDTKGEKEPKDYWTDKRVKKLTLFFMHLEVYNHNHTIVH